MANSATSAEGTHPAGIPLRPTGWLLPRKSPAPDSQAPRGRLSWTLDSGVLWSAPRNSCTMCLSSKSGGEGEHLSHTVALAKVCRQRKTELRLTLQPNRHPTVRRYQIQSVRTTRVPLCDDGVVMRKPAKPCRALRHGNDRELRTDRADDDPPGDVRAVPTRAAS